MTGTNSMLQAAKLWEKTSAAGNLYLVGRLGGVRVLVMRNRDAGAEGEPDWHLFFADSSDKARQTSAEPAKPASSARTRGARRAYRRPAAQTAGGPDHASSMPDDPLDDLWQP